MNYPISVDGQPALVILILFAKSVIICYSKKMFLDYCRENIEHMEKKKVLICGIRDFGSRAEGQYFMTREDGDIKFCEGIVLGESGAKKILSCVEIDEIIAIGSSNQCVESKDGKQISIPYHKIKLNEGIELFVSDTENFSDFDFFRYRLTQFVEGINIDTADFFETLECNRREEILDQMKEIFGDDLSQAIWRFVQEEEIQEKTKILAKSLTEQERHWMKAYLHSVLARKHQITAKVNNASIPISFVPITDDSEQKVINRFSNLISELLTEKDKEIELYVDLHGFSMEDSFVCMNALYALHEDPGSIIKIKDVVDEKIVLSGYLYEISLSSNRYRVQKLMVGINAFLQNGKTDILRDYWEESKKRNTGQNNDYIERLLLAMSHVDAGISLCSIGELEKGIYGLRKLLVSSEPKSEITEEGEALFMTLKEAIINDYGALLEKSEEEINSLELVKWAYKKKFYQQVITIIESRMPAEMVKRGIFYPAENEQEKMAYVKAINFHYWDSLQKDRYMFYDIEHYFIKFYGRFGVNYRDRSTDKTTEYTKRRIEQVFGGNEEQGLLPAHSLVKDKALLTMVLDKYYRLSNVRNMINHAISNNDAADLSESKLWNDVGSMIRDFIDIYERAIDSIAGQKCVQSVITAKEFKDYSYHHGPRMDSSFCEVPGYRSDRNRGQRRGGNRYNNKSTSYRDRRNNRTEQNPGINIAISVSQNRGIGGFLRKLFKGKQEQEKETVQEFSQGGINIKVNVD